MAAILLPPATPDSSSTCPFCQKSGFKRLGNHLPHCQARNGRSYEPFLSKKTVQNKERSSSCKTQVCPKCHRRFRRLDTHLRTSAICRSVSKPQEVSQNSLMEDSPAAISPDSLPGLSQPSDLQQDLTTPPTQAIDPVSKPKLCLPESDEEWKKADVFFEQEVVPCVIHELSVDDKYATLVEGVYSFFADNHGTKKVQQRYRSRQRKLAKKLKEAKVMKNAARRELRQARKEPIISHESINSISQKFLQCVRSHNKVHQQHERLQGKAASRAARQQCHDNLWHFCKDLLADKPDTDIQPTFSKSEATSFFSKCYHGEPRAYSQPSWMPSLAAPTVQFNEDDITLDEIVRAIKKARSRSSPSPFDGIPYIVFKKCTSLLPALHNLFNLCWACSIVPSAWKLAAIRLIGKPAAEADPSLPSNFRPIALTSCVGKLFSTILRNRWLSYMLSNKYFDRSVQKAFMPATAGCTEHHLKLNTILKGAKKNKKSLAVCWMDLANAYGSVHHSLIMYSLRHYYAPSKLTGLVQVFYSGLAAKISSVSWVSPIIPIEVGVYQGDPLSVVIFNTVINTLVDTLNIRSDLGYSFSRSQKPINLLQYADDTCIIGNSPASCQHLVNIMSTWLQWAGMEAKLPKCANLGLQASTGKKIDPKLSLGDQHIPYTLNGYKFLGLMIDVPSDISKSRKAVVTRLHNMLKKVDGCPLTRRQKLLVYKAGVCPRLSWLLTIEEFPISWVEKDLDPLVSRFLKKWTGMARSANTALLYLPQKDGGLNLPIISSLHKQLQISRQSHLLTSHDSSIRHMSEKAMQKDLSLSRMKFRASRKVRETMILDPSLSGKQLAKVTKHLMKEEEIANNLYQISKIWRNKGTCLDAPHQMLPKCGQKHLKECVMNTSSLL